MDMVHAFEVERVQALRFIRKVSSARKNIKFITVRVVWGLLFSLRRSLVVHGIIDILFNLTV